MVPYKDGGANEGHSCVKGRFAFGYATHKDRVTTPMIREKITDPWQAVSWDEAINYAAKRLKETQKPSTARTRSAASLRRARRTRKSTPCSAWSAPPSTIITSTRARASATRRPGYGLKQTFGESAGTQDFKSVDKTDVMLVIGANPTDAHPVFASRMKKRLREGAKLIVDRSAPHRSRALAACPGGLSPAASALDQRRDDERVRPRDCDREPYRPQVCQTPVRASGFLPLGRVHQAAGTFSRGPRADHWRSCPAGPRGRPPLRDRWQRRDLLRSWRHRA